MRTRSVLDAYAVLAYLNEESGHQQVKALLAADGADLIINAVNVGEVYYVLARARGLREADYFLTVILPSLPVTVAENALHDVIAAARLKAVHSLSYADCFAAATAIREKAPLVTGDPEFRKLGKDLSIEWLS